MAAVLRGDIVEAGQILPIDLAVIGFLIAGAVGAARTGIEKAHVGIAAEFAHGVQAPRFDAVEPFLFSKLPIDGQVRFAGMQRRGQSV